MKISVYSQSKFPVSSNIVQYLGRSHLLRILSNAQFKPVSNVLDLFFVAANKNHTSKILPEENKEQCKIILFVFFIFLQFI